MLKHDDEDACDVYMFCIVWAYFETLIRSSDVIVVHSKASGFSFLSAVAGCNGCATR